MTDLPSLEAEAAGVRRDIEAIRDAVGQVIVGQDRVVECAVTAILCGGNVLLEGVPGLGKTELVKALSWALNLDFSRIQFTPDLMPADIIGTSVMSTDNSGHYKMEFRKGPVFTQLLLADEINRATPKTQSALLETMQEGTVTTGGVTHRLEPPFFVLATQNPLEQEGTYPLPEAQLDRFLFKVDVPFPDRDGLNEILERTVVGMAREISHVVDGGRILEIRKVLRKVVVAPPLRDYAVRLVLGSHPETAGAHDLVPRYVQWGASPRAAQGLLNAGRVAALADGRTHLAHEDVRRYAREILQHRVILNYDGQAEDVSVGDVVGALVEATPESAPEAGQV